MSRVIIAKGTTASKYVTNGIHKRLVTDAEIAELVFTEAAEWNAGVPFTMSQTTINAIRTV